MLTLLLVIGHGRMVNLLERWVMNIFEYRLDVDGWVMINEAHYYEHYLLHDKVVSDYIV